MIGPSPLPINTSPDSNSVFPVPPLFTEAVPLISLKLNCRFVVEIRPPLYETEVTT